MLGAMKEIESLIWLALEILLVWELLVQTLLKTSKAGSWKEGVALHSFLLLWITLKLVLKPLKRAVCAVYLKSLFYQPHPLALLYSTRYSHPKCFHRVYNQFPTIKCRDIWTHWLKFPLKPQHRDPRTHSVCNAYQSAQSVRPGGNHQWRTHRKKGGGRLHLSSVSFSQPFLPPVKVIFAVCLSDGRSMGSGNVYIALISYSISLVRLCEFNW